MFNSPCCSINPNADLCLECKGCERECPSNVDLAKIKYEFLAHYNEKHGTPLRARMFAGIQNLNKWGSRFAPLANAVMGLHPVKWMLDQFVGIDSRRQMPPFASESFEKRFRKRSRPSANGRPRVVLFHDCFLNYNYPQVGHAATELLEKTGYEVILANKKCCGRPMISKGLIEDAKAVANHNIGELQPYVKQGPALAIVSSEQRTRGSRNFASLAGSPSPPSVVLTNKWTDVSTATMESIQEKLFPSNRFRLVALSPDAKEERRTVQLIRGQYTNSPWQEYSKEHYKTKYFSI